MKENKMELDLNQILVDVIKLDSSLQNSIKREVKDSIVNKIVGKFTDEYFTTNYRTDKLEIEKEVASLLAEGTQKIITNLITAFTDKLRYYGKDKTQKAIENFNQEVKKMLSELEQLDR